MTDLRCHAAADQQISVRGSASIEGTRFFRVSGGCKARPDG